MQEKKVPLLADVRDESAQDVRIVLEPKNRNVDANMLMELLFKNTELETKFNMNMNVLDSDGVPRVMSIAEVLRDTGVIVISDEIYSELSYAEEHVSIASIPGMRERTIVISGFSKAFAMTGWRLGWVCGNPEAIKFFAKLKSTIDNGIFKPLQKAAAEVLNSKEGENYIKQANESFKKRQQIMVEGLKELGWSGFNVPDATFYLWLPIPSRYKSSLEFTEDLMHKSGVIAVPGEGFGQYGEGFFRISIVCSEEKLYEVIQRMKEDGFRFE